MNTEDYKKIGLWLNKILRPYNYQVAPLAPAGKPGKVQRNVREFRLQLINKHTDTSEKLITELGNILATASSDIKGIKFNSLSPNSSKFPSYSFLYNSQPFDLVIGRGANRGENFETKTVADLSESFKVNNRSGKDITNLIELLNNSNEIFKDREISDVRQRTGSTKKEGIQIEKLGEIIGDIVLTDTTNHKWYVSLKDANGSTFSSYSGAASLFNNAGDLQPDSPGAEFLKAFGVDLNKVQEGFDIRNRKKNIRKKLPINKPDPQKIKNIFERAWGMNYFYVRRMPSAPKGWKVFWLDRAKLNKLTSSITVSEIKYPSLTSKQITILCGNGEQDYLIELRNSKAGEYPNDTKFKVKP